MSATDWLKQLSELDSSINQHTVSKAKAIASSFIKDKDAIMSELNNGCGYHVLHNLPVDVKLPSQPDNGLRPYHKNYISEHVLTGVTGTLGYNVFSYKQEKQGSLVHEITPTAGNENDRSSNGIVEFGFHTDAAYLPREIRPEILALLCLKNDSTTGTEIVSLENITRHLSSKVVDILKSKNFIIRAPHSFNIESKTLTSLLN
ncbi:hypothetical protein ACRS85_11155 [Pluralibacter gergoviae]|uniref:hypothetical protein n=1 Tax=Pluralibacter gergoviae TaxID=61647 RepID=UPI003EE304D7